MDQEAGPLTARRIPAIEPISLAGIILDPILAVFELLLGTRILLLAVGLADFWSSGYRKSNAVLSASPECIR